MTLTLMHRRYVDFSHAHYAGNLVDGAYVLALFGDIATDVCLQLDGDEGLFASYSTVTFHQPVHAGDVLEVTATVSRVGNRSRDIDFIARIVTRSLADGSTRGHVLPEPLQAVSASGTVVVPAAEERV
jgi:3-aminobutyryl-CoA ammonia-lyase